MAVVHEKLAALSFHNNDGESSRDIKLRVHTLRKLHDERSSIEAVYREEKQKLDLKYQALYAPLYEKRSGIISGSIEPDANDEIGGIEEISSTTSEEGRKKEEQGIPEFWLTAFCNHGMIESIIGEKDYGALRYLKDVRSLDREDMKGFKLEFHFHPNPYFENEILTKEYEVEQSIEGEAVLENTIGTEIKWKEGMNLCQHSVKKKQRSKGARGGTAQTRTITKIEPCASFFNLFNPIDITSVEEESEEHELLLRQLDSDFQLGYVIHDRIVPDALLWYTGEADEADDSDYEPGEESEDSEDEEEEEEEEDEEDHESSPITTKGGKAETSATGKTGEQPTECKPQ